MLAEGRRGPTPALSDAQLLAAMRSDLARSPFLRGEGHRKVHARLRILDDIRVSRTRVLRVMRAQAGEIITEIDGDDPGMPRHAPRERKARAWPLGLRGRKSTAAHKEPSR